MEPIKNSTKAACLYWSLVSVSRIWSKLATLQGPPSETGSEFDTDLEDNDEGKTEYDSSGIDFYLKVLS